MAPAVMGDRAAVWHDACLNALRLTHEWREHRRDRTGDVPAVQYVSPAADQFAVREALTKAMKTLSHKQRTIFVLTYVEGYKIREVSEMLGKAEGTVKSTLHRAVLILREELKDFRE